MKRKQAQLETYGRTSPGCHDRYVPVGVVGLGVSLIGVS
jgi:hypothetical protein